MAHMSSCLKNSRSSLTDWLFICVDDKKKQVNYKKAYDIVTKTWIVDGLKMYKISNKVIKFITGAMKNWKVELTAGEKKL